MPQIKANRQSMIDLQSQFERLEEQIKVTLAAAEHAISNTLAVLQDALRHARDDFELAEHAYYACLDNSESHDGCADVQAAFYTAHQRVSELEAQTWAFERESGGYEKAAQLAYKLVDTDMPACITELGARAAILDRLRSELGAIAVGLNSGSAGTKAASTAPDGAFSEAGVAATLVGALANLPLGGGHGSKYRAARQTFLRSLLDDENQPQYVKGWVKQELNRLDQVRQAEGAGRRPPGGNRRHLRGIPGLDVGHRIPDIDIPENFRLEDAAVNRARPHVAKRLGLADRFR